MTVQGAAPFSTGKVLSPAITGAEVVLFTGAGASAPLGLPTTESFIQDLSKELQNDRSASVLGMAVDHLGTEANIESVLDLLVQWLEDPFLIPPWLMYARTPGISAEVVAERIPRLRQAALRTLATRFSDVDGERAHDLYLWLFLLLKGFADQWCPLPIFTTNYDWTFERVIERMKRGHTSLIDGFVSRPMGQVWDPGAFHRVKGGRIWQIPLFKLHGSTSWYRQRSGIVAKIMHAEKDPGQLTNALIYPTQSKSHLVSVDPFGTGYDYLRACLGGGARLCVVIGYSFRDPEIMEAFRTGLLTNPKLRLFIVDPKPAKDRILRGLVAERGRIIFIEDDFRYYGLDRNHLLRDKLVSASGPSSILMRKI